MGIQDKISKSVEDDLRSRRPQMDAISEMVKTSMFWFLQTDHNSC